jgi:PAS domain S-box-containing protein
MRPGSGSGRGHAAAAREIERLRALRRFDLLDTNPDENLRDCVALAAQICGTPTAMISLVDEERQWALSQVGAAVTEGPRDASFCSHAILQPEIFEVPDALQDVRFAHNPFVVGPPHVRFYAGAPLLTLEGHALGTLCVMDAAPRDLSDQQRMALRSLARQVAEHLELRLLAATLKDQAELLWLAHDAIIVRNDAGEVLSWNRGAQELYGWSAEEATGALLHELLHTQIDGSREEFDRALSVHGSWEGELRQVTKLGRRILVRSRSVLKEGRRGVSQVILEINTDITEQKRNAEERERLLTALRDQNAQLRELDRVKDEFVASVSHEVRTPVASLRAYSEYLSDGDAGALNEEQRHCLGVIERNAQRVLQMVNGLLFLAGNDAGSMRLELARVDLAELAAESIEGFKPIARENEISVSLDRSGPTVVEGDRARLIEVVDNLLANALKFTPADGAVTVHATGDVDRVILHVEDSGSGVPATEERQIFERFYRASNARDQAIPGSGLGLAVSKVIMEAHGGNIGVRRADKQGSIFWIELPSPAPAAPSSGYR